MLPVNYMINYWLAQTIQSKPAIVHATPSPTTLRATPQTHIHNGQNCSCKRRILGAAVTEQTGTYSIQLKS